MPSMFAISYDAAAASAYEDKLIPFVSNMRHTIEWTRPYSGLFIITSESEARDILDALMDFLGNAVSLLVSEIEVGAIYTFLPRPAIDWIIEHGDPDFWKKAVREELE